MKRKSLEDSAESPSGSDTDDLEDEDEEAAPIYPPWLQKIAEGVRKHVRVVQEGGTLGSPSRPGYVNGQEIEIQDAADAAHAASGDGAAGIIKTHTLQRTTVVQVLAGDKEPPYIGIVDQIWRKAGAQQQQQVLAGSAAGDGAADAAAAAGSGATPAADAAGVAACPFYDARDVFIECYWFYRRRELPLRDAAWRQLRASGKVPSLTGGRFKLGDSAKARTRTDPESERQLLFSSHHSRHDPQDLVAVDAELHTCKLHWLGLREPAPERAIHKGRLMRTREPGFVVQGFLWCNSRDRPLLGAGQRRVLSLDGDWGDDDTTDIVRTMCKAYKRSASLTMQRNQQLMQQHSSWQDSGGADMDPDDEQACDQAVQKLPQWDPAKRQQPHQLSAPAAALRGAQQPYADQAADSGRQHEPAACQ